MSSLKSFIPQVAKALGVSTDALYERQRAAVRLGLLHPISGRGPGSGVELSSDSLAVLLICLGGASGLSEVDSRIAKYCNATPINGRSGSCRLTGENKFRNALSKILTHLRLATPLDCIVFHHDRPFIEVRFWHPPSDDDESLFGNKAGRPPGYSSMSRFTRDAIVEIAELLASESKQ